MAHNLYLNGELVTNLVIPEDVTSIGDYAFYGCESLTSITISGGVTSIGYKAFCGCTSLTNIAISESVTSIDDGAFSGCTGLTSITIRRASRVLAKGRSAIAQDLKASHYPSSVQQRT